MLLFQFFITQTLAITNLTVGIDITNLESLNFVARLDQYYKSFSEKGLLLEILNHILPCYSCHKRHQYKQPEPNCFAGGKYCQYSPYTSGQMILLEIIRQRCLFDYDKSTYLNYINYFEKDCVENPHYTYCSQLILQQKMNIFEFDIDKCVNNSFEHIENKQISENFILKNETSKQFNQSKLTIYLDNENVSQLKFQQIIELICKKLINDSPSYCDITNSLEKNTRMSLDDQLFFWLFILLIIILIIISSIIMNKTRGLLKKQLSVPFEETVRIIQEENIP